MIGLITVVHVAVCVFLVIVVLLQHGKGADAGAGLAGGSQTVFGASGGATFLSKVTTALAITFMITSLSLAYLAANRSTSSIVDEFPETESTTSESVDGGMTGNADGDAKESSQADAAKKATAGEGVAQEKTSEAKKASEDGGTTDNASKDQGGVEGKASSSKP